MPRVVNEEEATTEKSLEAEAGAECLLVRAKKHATRSVSAVANFAEAKRISWCCESVGSPARSAVFSSMLCKQCRGRPLNHQPHQHPGARQRRAAAFGMQPSPPLPLACVLLPELGPWRHCSTAGRGRALNYGNLAGHAVDIGQRGGGCPEAG